MTSGIPVQAPIPQRPRPDFHILSMPKGNVADSDEWWEGGSVSSDDTTEYRLNLGAETPTSEGSGSIPVDQWAPSSSFQPTSSSSYSSSSQHQQQQQPRKREWTILAGNGSEYNSSSDSESSSISHIDEWRSKREVLLCESEREKAGKKAAKDRDCGICFMYAVEPCRTLCCGKIFCREHIADWLEGPSSNGLCPACELPCSFEAGTEPLTPKSLSTRNRSGTVTLANYRSQNRPSSPLRLSTTTSPISSKNQRASSPIQADSSSTNSSSTASPATTVASTAETIEQWEQIQDADIGVSFSPLKALGKMKGLPSPFAFRQREKRDDGEEGEEGEGETLEVLSRMASLAGFALVLYALFG